MDMQSRIYLDHAATTPVAESVLDAMLPYFRDQPGNAHSRSHAAGWTAAAAVQQAREQLGALLECAPEELTFTSGATEAITLALLGIAHRYSGRGRHLITSTTEHAAVSSACAQLEREGFEVSYVETDANGLISSDLLSSTIRPDTILVALLWANNETGVLQDMAAISAVCQRRQVLLFADATQICGKLPCHPKALGIDALACSAHKFYGPKGVGALFLDQRSFPVGITPIWAGGGQENGLRGGTLNVPGIVGMGAAAVLANLKVDGVKAEQEQQAERLTQLRNAFERDLKSRVPELRINGAGAPRLPHISNLSFRFTEAEALLSKLQRQLAVSTGSACASADLEPSHVLLAMGLDREDARAAIRVSLGRDTRAEDMQIAADLLVDAVAALRLESPAWEMHLDGIL